MSYKVSGFGVSLKILVSLNTPVIVLYIITYKPFLWSLDSGSCEIVLGSVAVSVNEGPQNKHQKGLGLGFRDKY